MTRRILALALILLTANSASSQNASWPPERTKESEFSGRRLETFLHGNRSEWGYAQPQQDTFLVLHPVKARANASLYVVLHSAGHDVHSCLACTTRVGNHDIYHSPPDFFALYLDCRANKGDWWWGINNYPEARRGSRFPLKRSPMSACVACRCCGPVQGPNCAGPSAAPLGRRAPTARDSSRCRASGLPPSRRL